MIRIDDIELNIKTFPNGETRMDDIVPTYKACKEDVIIKFKFESDAELFHLKVVVDTLKNHGFNNIRLVMPYCPYSRMDRVEGEVAFTLKSFCEFINDLNFKSVCIYEPHSDVCVALLDRVCVINETQRLYGVALDDTLTNGYDYDDIFVVYPDAGAEKRYSKQIENPNVMTCSKHRDFKTGEIKSINLHGYEEAQNCRAVIIVDDLCSKGGTFLGTAKLIKEKIPTVEKIILCITHCENIIFKGTILQSGLIDKIYTTNSILDTESEDYKNNESKFYVKEVV